MPAPAAPKPSIVCRVLDQFTVLCGRRTPAPPAARSSMCSSFACETLRKHPSNSSWKSETVLSTEAVCFFVSDLLTRTRFYPGVLIHSAFNLENLTQPAIQKKATYGQRIPAYPFEALESLKRREPYYMSHALTRDRQLLCALLTMETLE
jgi:hypothetical protein